MKYNYNTLASLGQIKIVLSDFVPDHIIVLKAHKPSSGITNFASYYISMWHVDGEHKGKIFGDCDPTKATEMHMNGKRYSQLKDMCITAAIPH